MKQKAEKKKKKKAEDVQVLRPGSWGDGERHREDERMEVGRAQEG